jgi:hypothetical protein
MALRILTTDFPVAFAGDAYSLRTQVTGGTPPYTFAATGLPTGITLDTSSGELTATIGTISGSEVADYSVTITVSDSAAGSAAVSETLTVRPASFRRARSLVVDPSLQSIIQEVDQGSVTRERLTSHFAEVPEGELSDGNFVQDTFAHWSSQVLVGSPGDDVEAALTLDATLTALALAEQTVAEPQFIEVAALTPTVGVGSSGTVIDVDRTNSVFITELTDGPVYDSTDDAQGYPAVAMKFTPSVDMTISTLTLDLKRAVADQTGNVIVTVCRGNSPTEIQIPAGDTSLAYGDGTQIMASGTVDVASLPVDTWQATAVTLSDVVLGLALTANIPYYIVVSSDYTSPGPSYVELGVSTDASELAAYPINPPVIVEATVGTPHSNGFESGGVYAQYVDDGAATLTFALSATLVVTIATQDGVATVAQVDASAFNAPNERFWVGSSPLSAIRLLMTNPSGTGYVDLTDGAGNPVEVVDVTDGSGGSAVDASGYLVNQDLIVQVSVPVTGLLPPVPFYVHVGAERRLTDLAVDAMMRNAQIH